MSSGGQPASRTRASYSRCRVRRVRPAPPPTRPPRPRPRLARAARARPARAWAARAPPATAAARRSFAAVAALAGGDLVAARRGADEAVSTTAGVWLMHALMTRSRVAIAQGEPE